MFCIIPKLIEEIELGHEKYCGGILPSQVPNWSICGLDVRVPQQLPSKVLKYLLLSVVLSNITLVKLLVLLSNVLLIL